MPVPLNKYVFHGSSKRIAERYLSYYPNFKLKTYQKVGEPIIKIVWGGSHLYSKDIGVDASGNILPTTHHYLTTYNELEGDEDIVYPNGKPIYHYYDSFGRLIEIEDELFRPVTRYYYNYGK